ncbi:EAL domain-containing protein [Microbacterium sp. P05]|uniref:EAL domain-containing protein n=1 Tax=Microbacterium sp. P05 TaxID=3366948 RepID=UPI0037473E49
MTTETLIDTLLPTAVADGVLGAVFQPLVDVSTGRIVGAEALARWTDPVLGEVPPHEFIPVAERTGLIEDLGLQMLRSAWQATERWGAAGHAVGVSVNVSALQLATHLLDDAVAGMVAGGPGDAQRLTLEITETQLFGDIETASARLRDLAAMGAHVSIDDFGVGYSSLERIEDLPVSEIKIDMSMVHDFSPGGEEALRAIADYAHARDIELVAEGVETPEHLARIREIGCHRAQGYLFARPMSEDAFLEVLEENAAA